MQVYVFEGPDGAGKSSSIEAIKKQLENNGYEVVIFRQPGGTPIGERFREMLLSVDTPILPITQAYMFAASRYETLKAIENLLKVKKDIIVLVDRWNISTMVYQNVFNELEEENPEYLKRNKAEIEGIGLLSTMTQELDLNFFYITAKLETLLQRRPIDESVDRFEIGGLTTRTSIYNKYEEYYAKYKDELGITRLLNDAVDDQQKLVDNVCKNIYQ